MSSFSVGFGGGRREERRFCGGGGFVKGGGPLEERSLWKLFVKNCELSKMSAMNKPSVDLMLVLSRCQGPLSICGNRFDTSHKRERPRYNVYANPEIAR